MKNYFGMVGIATHFVLTISLVLYAFEYVYNLEVGNHEYSMASYYSKEYYGKRVNRAVKDAMLDNKITWKEYDQIEAASRKSEYEKNMIELKRNISK